MGGKLTSYRHLLPLDRRVISEEQQNPTAIKKISAKELESFVPSAEWLHGLNSKTPYREKSVIEIPIRKI